jgi:hypothetical protein
MRQGHFILWPAVNAIALFAVASCFYLLGVCKAEKIPLFAIYIVLWMPAMDGLIMGQVHLFILALLAVFLVACEREAGRVAGISLALAIHLKMTPVVLLPVLLTKKGRSARIPFLAAMLSLAVFSALFDGPSIFTRFLESSSTLGYGDNYWNHASNMTPAKMLTGSLFGLSAAEAVMAQRALVAAILALSVLQALRSRRVDTDTTTLGARLIVLMVLASPIIWYHHLVWLVIPFGVALKGGGFRRKAVVAVLLFILTASVYIQVHLHVLHGSHYGSTIGPVLLIFVGMVLLTLLKAAPTKPRVSGITSHKSAIPWIGRLLIGNITTWKFALMSTASSHLSSGARRNGGRCSGSGWMERGVTNQLNMPASLKRVNTSASNLSAQ